MKKFFLAVVLTLALVSSSNVMNADGSFPTCYPCDDSGGL